MTQPLARLAFYLLEPRSDDGLVDWNVLDEAIGDARVFPIVQVPKVNDSGPGSGVRDPGSEPARIRIPNPGP